jgi:hypothetical protein
MTELISSILVELGILGLLAVLFFAARLVFYELGLTRRINAKDELGTSGSDHRSGPHNPEVRTRRIDRDVPTRFSSAEATCAQCASRAASS